MNTRDGRVDRDDPVDLPSSVRLLLHLGQQHLPRAIFSPPVEPLVDRIPLPEPLRHIPPRRPSPVFPRDPLNSEPMIRPRPRAASGRRHQRLYHGPQPVRDLLSRHRSRLTQPRSKPLDQHGLALECANRATPRFRISEGVHLRGFLLSWFGVHPSVRADLRRCGLCRACCRSPFQCPWGRSGRIKVRSYRRTHPDSSRIRSAAMKSGWVPNKVRYCS